MHMNTKFSERSVESQGQYFFQAEILHFDQTVDALGASVIRYISNAKVQYLLLILKYLKKAQLTFCCCV